MLKNRGKSKNKLKFLIFIVSAVAVLSIILFKSTSKVDIGKSENWEKYMVIGKNNVFVVYGDKLAVQVPFEIYMNKDGSLGDIVKKKNYEEVLKSLNDILPEKVDHYKVVRSGQIEINTANMKKIPEISMEDKRYALTSSLNAMFLELYYDNATNKGNTNIIIDVLNANGRSGYARKAGEKLVDAFSLKYNAANFDNFEQYSYIQNKDLSDKELKGIVMELDEKYFKIKKDGDLPTLANAVVVLGREQEGILGINIYSDKSVAENTSKKLKKIGYKIVNSKKLNSDIESSYIEYNKEDYYTAYKLSKRLDIKNMVEKNNLNEVINIFIK